MARKPMIQPNSAPAQHPEGFASVFTSATYGTVLLQAAAVAVVAVLLGQSVFVAFSLPAQWAPLFVVATLLPFVAVAVGNLHRLLLAVILLNIPFKLEIHLDYRPQAADLGAVGGLGISATTLALAALYALWAAELLVAPRMPARSKLQVNWPLALFVAFAALSAAAAGDRTLAIFQLFLFVQTFLLHFYVINRVRDRNEIIFIATVLLAGLALEGMVMLAMLAAPGNFSVAGISGRADLEQGSSTSFYRLSGTLGSPGNAAGYLSLLLPLAFSFLLSDAGRALKRLAILALGLGGLALILTFTRGGWMAFVISLALISFLVSRRGILSPRIPLALLLVIPVAALPFQDAIGSRLLAEESATSRFPLMELAFKMIASNPLLGVGANNFAVNIGQFATPDLGGEWLYTVHNVYLRIWAESGIFALLFFLVFLLTTLHQGWASWRSRDPLLSAPALGLTAGLVGHMVHMTVDVFNDRQPVQSLWLVAALITALHRVHAEHAGPRSPDAGTAHVPAPSEKVAEQPNRWRNRLANQRTSDTGRK